MPPWLQKPIRFFVTFSKKPLLAAFMLGMTSGFPLTIILGIMTVWLRQYDIEKSTIGMFSWATLFYSLKIFWAPLLDKVRLGRVAQSFGARRAWIFVVILIMSAAILALSQQSPDKSLTTVALLSATIGFLSASLDILIDAYRIEVTDERDLAHSAAMYQWGYRLANLLAGVGVFTIANYYGWSLALALLPILALPGLLAIFWVGEPTVEDDEFLVSERKAHRHYSEYQLWLYEAVVLPFKEFMRRQNWFFILVFIVLVKFGDVMAAVMTGPFLEELGFTLLEMAYANKAVGAVAAAAGAAFGIYVWWALDVFKALFVSVIAMMVTNLGFVWLALVGNDTTALAIAIGLENFASGVGGTVMIAYFGSLCNLSFTATQYALLSTLASLARGFFGGFSGFAADALNWPEFFLVSTLMALPGLIALLVLKKRGIQATNST